MNSQTVATNVEHTENTTRIMSLLETLRQKVINFAVLDVQGQRVGEVKDLVLDANRQLNLVIAEDASQQGVDADSYVARHRLFLLPSKSIKKIDTSARSVFLEMDKLQLESIPEYLETEKASNQEISDNLTVAAANTQNINSSIESAANLEHVVEEDIIRLLGERLIVDSSKRKIGEVIVRKEIETRMVQVPVRREKLIIEQVSPEHKQLAEIDLGLEEISSIELGDETPEVTSFDGGLTVSGEFSSPKIASLVLNAIALERNNGCKKVRVTIEVEDESRQKTYKEWFDRCSKDQEPKPEK